jgi:uncharacterized membrane protein (UPF0127 family)
VITSLVVFLITYVFVGLIRVPRIPVNRSSGALIPATSIAVSMLVLAVGAQVSQGSQRPPASGDTPMTLKTITVTSADPAGPRRSFAVVLRAGSTAAREKGLQGFRALKPREAALFVFDPPQQVSFWMASLTYAIDIIYVDAAGTVTEVFPGCQPESREVFSSAGPVRWVIETAAGSGIRPGDGVRFE